MDKAIFFRQLGRQLRQPQWIAVILSLGFHGVLFAAGPSFSSLNMNALGGNIPEQERRQVPLIELTPEEQSRLPDFSNSAYSLFPDQANPFELFPPSGSSLPLNPQPETTAPAKPTPLRPTPGSGSVAVGIAPYRPPQRPSIFLPPRQSPLSTLPSGPTFSNGEPVPQVTRAPQPSSEDNASTPTPVEPDSTDLPTASDLALANPAGQPERENSAPLNGANGETSGSSPANPLEAQIEALAYRPENTTAEEAEANLEAWQASLEERLPGELDQGDDPIEMLLPYVQRLCLDPEPTDALIGLLALPTAEGDDLELFPQVLKSTGYPFLDQEAVVALEDLKTPPENDEPEKATGLEPAVMYQVQVEVEYDEATCIDRESLLEEIKANQAPSAAPEASPAAGQSDPEAPPSGSGASISNPTSELEEQSEPAGSSGVEPVPEQPE